MHVPVTGVMTGRGKASVVVFSKRRFFSPVRDSLCCFYVLMYAFTRHGAGEKTIKATSAGALEGEDSLHNL